jgi:hypothetical protein
VLGFEGWRDLAQFENVRRAPINGLDGQNRPAENAGDEPESDSRHGSVVSAAENAPDITYNTPMKSFRIITTALVVLLIVATGRAQQTTVPTIDVVRDPGCGCCLGWVAHLQRAGFKTTVVESADRLKNSKVPASARSCHTGTIAGYLIEGHVPAADIKRLLAERPKVLGIAAPGMPAGSPGMETPGGAASPYDVVSFDESGNTKIFASHR